MDMNAKYMWIDGQQTAGEEQTGQVKHPMQKNTRNKERSARLLATFEEGVRPFSVTDARRLKKRRTLLQDMAWNFLLSCRR